MSKAADRLRQFSSSGVSLHGVRSGLMLAASAALVLATTALMPGAAKGAEVQQPAEVVQSIQASLDAELGAGSMLIGHAGIDMEKAFSKLGNGDLNILFRGIDDSPSIESYFRGQTGVFDIGEVTQDHLDSFMLYRQVATAFAGPSPTENERTAFAAFAVLHDGAPIELLHMLAAKSELDELTGVDNDLSFSILQHVISVSTEPVADNLKNFSLKEIEAISSQFSNSARDSKIPEGFGAVIARSLENEAFFIPVQEGAVVGTAQSWLESASKVPEIGRIVDLQSFLYDRNSTNVEYTRFDADPQASAREIAKLAMAGDTVARLLAPVIGLEQDFRYSPISQASDLPTASEIAGEPLLFNRDELYVYTDAKSRALFATTREHDLVFIAKPEGMHRTFYEQSGHDATYVEQVAAYGH